MSIDALLRVPEARALLDSVLPAYRRTVSSPKKVCRSHRHPRLAGTAIDYALRLELSHRHPSAAEEQWVAEDAAEHLFRARSPEAFMARKVVREARAASRRWPKKLQARYRRIAYHASRLAQLDQVVRAARPPTFGSFDGVDERGIARDVEAMLHAADPLFDAIRDGDVLVNPSFGRWSEAVGGADADLIARDALYDVKASANNTLERHHVRQLVAYASLAWASERRFIHLAGVYFARFGQLRTVELTVNRRCRMEVARGLAAIHETQQRDLAG